MKQAPWIIQATFLWSRRSCFPPSKTEAPQIMQEDDVLNSMSAANALSQNAAIQLKNRSCVSNSCRWMSMLTCWFARAGSQRQISGCQNLSEINSGYAIGLGWVCTAGMNQENEKFQKKKIMQDVFSSVLLQYALGVAYSCIFWVLMISSWTPVT